MAKWRFDFRGIKVVGRDENGWAITEFVYPFLEFEDSSIRRVEVNSLNWAREQLPDIHGLVELGYERVDKRTDYGYVYTDHHYEDDIPRLKLTDDQKRKLEILQQKIVAKVSDEEPGAKKTRFIGSGYEWIVSVGNNTLAFYQGGMGGGGYYPHEKGLQFINELQRFYSRITPDELIVLNAAHSWGLTGQVTHEEMLAIRRVSAYLKT